MKSTVNLSCSICLSWRVSPADERAKVELISEESLTPSRRTPSKRLLSAPSPPGQKYPIDSERREGGGPVGFFKVRQLCWWPYGPVGCLKFR